MRTTLKVLAIIGIVIGGLAVLGSFADESFASFVGGLFYMAQGIISLAVLNETK